MTRDPIPVFESLLLITVGVVLVTVVLAGII